MAVGTTSREAGLDPGSGPTPVGLGPIGWLRWGWRQLTSMRTALFLLLLLAVGAVPGSIFPQRGVDASRVKDYLDTNPQWGPIADRFGLFNVYGSPWFSAVYLLLFTSLIGCVIPRTRVHLRAMLSRPPRTPSRLRRLPAYRSVTTASSAETVLDQAQTVLRRRRYRVVRHADGSIAAERGYLRETGNLLFHVSLIGLLVAVAAGALFGYRGTKVVTVGDGFANSLSEWDSQDLGVYANPEDLPPFQFTLDSLEVRFETGVPVSSAQFAAPRDFSARVTVVDNPGEPPRQATVRVNNPLQVQGVSMSLAGNGYAPSMTVRNPKGEVVASGPVVFKAQDKYYLSTGVVKTVGKAPQIGLDALFAPTADTDAQGPISRFPDLIDPRLFFTAYKGDLGIDTGQPQSVYQLDLKGMKPFEATNGKSRVWSLGPGEAAELPDGSSVTLDGVKRFAAFQISYDPAKNWALIFSILSIAGLTASLFVPRRRIWVRPHENDGATTVEVAGLARGDDPRLASEVEGIVSQFDPQPIDDPHRPQKDSNG